jgi:APA family basic amino acid/polyamine antiporter
MGEEIRFPQVTLPRALFLTPFIVFSVTALFQWFLLGIVPPEGLGAVKEAMAPYAEGMKAAGILGFPLVLLCTGIAFGGDLSTLNPSVGAPARYLYGMARDGVLPRVLGNLHPRFRTPHVAVAFLGLVTLLFVATGSIIYIASLSLFADLFYYIIGFAAFLGLRRRHPELPRPYRAPGGVVGAMVSILIYGVMMTQLPRDAFTTGVVWNLIGWGVYVLLRRRNPAPASMLLNPPKVEAPTPEESSELDREYRRWRLVTMGCFGTVLLVFLVPYAIR